ncbi:MAG: FtsW/RodA/SpoVE family cell cycle protein [Actinomycetota bacterium]
MAQASAYRRNTELSLLIIALIVGAGAMILAALALNEHKAGSTAPYISLTVVAYVAAHIVIRRFAREADPLLLPLAAVANTIGLAAIYRLSPKGLGPTQVIWTLVGIACFIATVVFLKDFRALARYKYIFGFTGLALLLLPATPLGVPINGAQLWLRFGGFSFQPGELAKLCLVIFFAAYLAERKELLAVASRRVAGIHLPDLKHFGPLVVMWAVSLLVMFYERDLGSSLLFFSIFIVMLYVATARPAYVAFGGGLFGLGAYMGYSAFNHVRERFDIWLHVFDPKLIKDQGYQLAQGLFAMATGGLFGTGLGRGRPDLIPEAATDFIFPVIGEELGLMGTAALLTCFFLLVGRGLKIALAQRDDFGQLLAMGLTTILGIQTIIILGGVTRLLPLTGITLPFVSYGGSSLLSNFILLGILVRISHHQSSASAPAHTEEILIGGRQ